MNTSHQINRFPPSSLLVVVLLWNASLVEASTITAPNNTLTTFDAVSGGITFDWDKNSIFDITGTDVTVSQSNITITGPQVVGTVYEFTIPNFYDPLPMKKIEITMQGANGNASGLALPSVLDVIGADSDYSNGGPALPVPGSFVSGKTSPTLVSEYWHMFPNPDFEIVTLYVPVEFELQSINIATQSTVVPIPASIWLLGSGLFGLMAMAKRNRAH